jgi:hypothetical protein
MAAFMITGIGVHDPPESAVNRCERLLSTLINPLFRAAAISEQQF